MESQAQTPKLLDQVRNVLRLHHYSIHTERSYLDWIKRYIHFHHMRSREDLAGAEAKIEAFLTSLFVDGTRGEGRTLNLRVRRPTLYPIELLAQTGKKVGQQLHGGNC